MGKIIVSENVTLDGVVEDPTGEEGCRHGGWFEQMSTHDRQEWAQVEFQEAVRASALLLGRRSDGYFGNRWNTRTGEWAARLNALPKYVVSSTLVEPVWRNSTVLTGDVPIVIEKLKQHIDGEIVVYASRPLVHTLLDHNLVDEVRLMLFPVLTGVGARLFAPTSDKRTLRRVDARTVGDSLSYLTYEVVR
jgi:dihydrofolate reductase